MINSGVADDGHYFFSNEELILHQFNSKQFGGVRKRERCFKRTTNPSSANPAKSGNLNQEGGELNETMVEQRI